MHIKATLAVTLTALSLGSAAVVAASPAPYLHQHNPHKYYGRHNKLSARSNLEDLARRNADAPYGYDRCESLHFTRCIQTPLTFSLTAAVIRALTFP